MLGTPACGTSGGSFATVFSGEVPGAPSGAVPSCAPPASHARGLALSCPEASPKPAPSGSRWPSVLRLLALVLLLAARFLRTLLALRSVSLPAFLGLLSLLSPAVQPSLGRLSGWSSPGGADSYGRDGVKPLGQGASRARGCLGEPLGSPKPLSLARSEVKAVGAETCPGRFRARGGMGQEGLAARGGDSSAVAQPVPQRPTPPCSQQRPGEPGWKGARRLLRGTARSATPRGSSQRPISTGPALPPPCRAPVLSVPTLS